MNKTKNVILAQFFPLSIIEIKRPINRSVKTITKTTNPTELCAAWAGISHALRTTPSPSEIHNIKTAFLIICGFSVPWSLFIAVYFLLSNVRGEVSLLAFGIRGCSAAEMPKVPKGQGLPRPLRWAFSFCGRKWRRLAGVSECPYQDKQARNQIGKCNQGDNDESLPEARLAIKRDRCLPLRKYHRPECGEHDCA